MLSISKSWSICDKCLKIFERKCTCTVKMLSVSSGKKNREFWEFGGRCLKPDLNSLVFILFYLFLSNTVGNTVMMEIVSLKSSNMLNFHFGAKSSFYEIKKYLRENMVNDFKIFRTYCTIIFQVAVNVFTSYHCSVFTTTCLKSHICTI